MGGNKITRKDEPINDNRVDTSPTPPPMAYRRERHKSHPYRNDEPPPQRKQETTDIRRTELYKSPRHGDPLAQMRMQIATAELRMGCTLLVGVDEATPQGHVEDRTTPEERQNKTANLKRKGKKRETALGPYASQRSTTSQSGRRNPSPGKKACAKTDFANRHRAKSIESNNCGRIASTCNKSDYFTGAESPPT